MHGTEVTISRVPDHVREDLGRKAGTEIDQPAAIATVDELPDYDASVLATPTRIGNMREQIRGFPDQDVKACSALDYWAIELWLQDRGEYPMASIPCGTSWRQQRRGSTVLPAGRWIDMKRTSVSLNFMPAFFHKYIGAEYGEAYYFDPSHRAQVQRSEGRFLHEVLGRYGVGSPDPDPSPNLMIQSNDVVMRTQGAEWRFPQDDVVQSWSAPWAGLSPDEIAKIDPEEAAYHPLIDAVVAQYGEMERMYGDQADVFSTKQGVMDVHTPYTTAVQLCGDELFISIIADPEGTRKIFDKVWQIYRAVFARIASVTGARFNTINLGDCSATMLAENTYREVVLPINRRLTEGFEHVRYHSCGPSSHLLRAFATLPRLNYIELGAGTDLESSASLMPNVHMAPLVDPVVMLESDTDTVHDVIEKMIGDLRTAPRVTLCAWSFDRDTPLENVAQIYETVGALGSDTD